MGQAGARVESPMTLLREWTSAVRALLHGERLTVSGRYVTIDGVALDRPPATPPPVYIGGSGPKTLALAGSLADGLLLADDISPAGVRRQIAAAGLREGQEVAVYLGAALDLVDTVPVGDDEAAADPVTSMSPRELADLPVYHPKA